MKQDFQYMQTFIVFTEEVLKAQYQHRNPCATDLNIKGYF